MADSNGDSPKVKIITTIIAAVATIAAAFLGKQAESASGNLKTAETTIERYEAKLDRFDQKLQALATENQALRLENQTLQQQGIKPTDREAKAEPDRKQEVEPEKTGNSVESTPATIKPNKETHTYADTEPPKKPTFQSRIITLPLNSSMSAIIDEHNEVGVVDKSDLSFPRFAIAGHTINLHKGQAAFYKGEDNVKIFKVTYLGIEDNLFKFRLSLDYSGR